jgi:hypothetical protein
MLKEALQEIQKLCAERLTPTTLAIDGGNPLITYLWNPVTHQVEEFPRLPPARRHKVETLDSFRAAFESYGDAGADGGRGASTIWIGSDRFREVEATLICDDTNADARRDRISWSFKLSPLFVGLSSMPNEQRSLYRMLRHDLRSTKIEPPNFPEAVAKLKWTTTTTSVGEFGTMKSTLSREANSELTAIIDLPPELTVTFDPVPLLSGHPEWNTLVSIACSVTVEPEDETISISPFPGEVDWALDMTIDSLRQVLIKVLDVQPCSVLAGVPAESR